MLEEKKKKGDERMITDTKIEVWFADNPEVGEEPINTDEIYKHVAQLKEKILSMNDRTIVITEIHTREVPKFEKWNMEEIEKKDDDTIAKIEDIRIVTRKLAALIRELEENDAIYMWGEIITYLKQRELCEDKTGSGDVLMKNAKKK